VLSEWPESNRNEQPTAHHLSVQPTPFIGRERELAGIISHLYDPTCRLLTLVGPGGIGKTRLALQVVQTLKSDLSEAGHFAHGIHEQSGTFAGYHCALSPHRDAGNDNSGSPVPGSNDRTHLTYSHTVTCRVTNRARSPVCQSVGRME
jgi:hypothetical protein